MELIPRHAALDEARKFLESQCRLLLVEARAGQGKTVFAGQLRNMVSGVSGRLPVLEADNDPFVFWDRILDLLRGLLPHVDFTDLLELGARQVTRNELPELAAGKLAPLLDRHGEPLLLVFDDVHHLQAETSLELLKSLVQRLPARARAAILSRHAVLAGGKPLVPPEDRVLIDNDLLAFTSEETALFFNRVMQCPVDGQELELARRVTGGWAMGLLLYNLGGFRGGGKNPAGGTALDAYFDSVSVIPEECATEIALFGFLGDVPESFLASRGSALAQSTLRMLGRRNQFVSVDQVGVDQGGAEPVYAMHHLFRDYLRRRAVRNVPEKERVEFLVQTGQWFIAADQIEAGAGYLVEARDWARVSAVFRDRLFSLLARNRHATLDRLTGAVPEEVLRRDGWLALARGTAGMALAHADAEDFLAAAADEFYLNQDSLGELAALALIIQYHFTFSGEYRGLEQRLERCEQLYREHEKLLEPALGLQCLASLAVGNALCLFRVSKALEFGKKCDFLAREKGLLRDCPWAKLSKMTALGGQGNLQAIADEFEEFFDVYHSDQLSPFNRFSVAVVYLNYLEMRGRFFNYFSLRDEYMAEHARILSLSYLTPFLRVWELDALVAQGRYEDALRLVLEQLASPASGIDHIRSQFLHYKTLILALLGQETEALGAGRQALRTRAASGGRYFILLTRTLVGAALSLTSMKGTAERMLSRALAGSREAEEFNLRAAICFYRAGLHLRNRRERKARADVEEGLSALKRFEVYHFFGWNPQLMRRLLGFAVKHDILPGYARKLASRQMDADIDPDGTVTPFLRLGSSGEDTWLSFGREMLAAGDLNVRSRQLLEILARSPRMSAPVEEILEALWPHEPGIKARRNFDTALSRLRSQVRELTGQEQDRFLPLANKLLCLRHCKTDLDDVLFEAGEGRRLVADKKPWQAHCAFLRMHEAAVNIPGYPACFRENLRDPFADTKYLRAVLCWLDVLLQGGYEAKSLEVAESALEVFPLDDRLHGVRYRVLNSLGRPGEAAEALGRHRSYLVSRGYSEEDVQEMMDSIVNRSI